MVLIYCTEKSVHKSKLLRALEVLSQIDDIKRKWVLNYTITFHLVIPNLMLTDL